MPRKDVRVTQILLWIGLKLGHIALGLIGNGRYSVARFVSTTS
jgi:hypothetical protein